MKVIEVTNLNDSGPGSLRAAATASGPRVVVFRTGGTITLLDRIRVTNPCVYIAGQTAPGGGITLRNDPSNSRATLELFTQDAIVRYIRVRSGASTATTSSLDSINFGYARNAILDHVSASWATDQVVTSWYDSRYLTIQWSIISEGLENSTHTEGPHSTGLHLGDHGGYVSIHHNLIAQNHDRNPELNTVYTTDVVNNLVYGWDGRAMYTKDKWARPQSNMVGNYFKASPSTPDSTSGWEIRFLPYVTPYQYGTDIYVQGNIGPHRPSNSYPESEIVRPEDRQWIVGSRFDAPPVYTTDAFTAYEQVLSGAGVTKPTRDAVDIRVTNDVRNGTGRVIDDPSQVGGWPVLDPGVPPADGDHDGMPNAWELSHGLNQNVNDAAQDRDGDGYTNIEEYVNGLVLADTPGATVTPGSTATATATKTPAPISTATFTPTPTSTPTGSVPPTSTPTATNTPTVAPIPTTTAVPSTLTFGAEADSRVKETSPNTKYGTDTRLYADGGTDPHHESYIRFTVSGVAGAVKSATLRVYATEGSVNGPAVYATSNNWTEMGITWNNRPARTSGALDDKGAIGSNAWVDYNVTGLVTGNGTYSFVLATDSTDGVTLSSREGSFPPQLVVTLTGG